MAERGLIALPTVVQYCILSHLPISEAVQTSLVCSSWRTLFEEPVFSRKRIVLNGRNIYEHGLELGRSFQHRVNTFIRRFRGQTIHSLTLQNSYRHVPSQLLVDCVRFAAAKQVSEMTIDLVAPVGFSTGRLHTFPHTLLFRPTLSLLKLQSVCLSGTVESLSGFSGLKSLDLKGVSLDQATMANILVVCLQLQRLSIIKCWGSQGKELRCIALNKDNAGRAIQELKLVSCQKVKLEICATELYALEIDSSVAQLAVLTTPLLGSVSFSASRTRSLEEALNQFSYISRLHTLRILASNEIDETYILPKFNCLKRLTLVLSGINKGYSFAVEFIKNSPILQQFTFSFSGFKVEGSSSGCLDSPCFVHSHLEKVMLHGFSGVSYKMEVARCILKVAANLKELTLDPLLLIFRGRKDRDLVSGQGKSDLIISELQKVSVSTKVRISWTQDVQN